MRRSGPTRGCGKHGEHMKTRPHPPAEMNLSNRRPGCSHLIATLLPSMTIVLSLEFTGLSVSRRSKGICRPSMKRCSPVTTTEEVKPRRSLALVGDEPCCTELEDGSFGFGILSSVCGFKRPYCWLDWKMIGRSTGEGYECVGGPLTLGGLV